MEKNFKIFVVLALVSCVRAGARLDKLDVKVLDKTKVTCEVKVHLTKPKSVDIDVHALTDAKDVSVSYKFVVKNEIWNFLNSHSCDSEHLV